MTVTIFHNPNCSTSRAVLEMIRNAGHTPEVVDYVKVGWTADGLTALLADAGLSPREALRTRGDLAAELGLLDEGVSDATLLRAMVDYPVLVERPFVRRGDRAVLARPKERVLDLL